MTESRMQQPYGRGKSHSRDKTPAMEGNQEYSTLKEQLFFLTINEQRELCKFTLFQKVCTRTFMNRAHGSNLIVQTCRFPGLQSGQLLEGLIKIHISPAVYLRDLHKEEHLVSVLPRWSLRVVFGCLWKLQTILTHESIHP